MAFELPELPPLPIIAEASTSAMQIENFIPTISSAAAASSDPFNLHSTLAPSYPVSPFPSYLDFSSSNTLTTTSNVSNDFSYNPLLDLSYSTALLAMFNSLPPTMPPAGGPGAMGRGTGKGKRKNEGSGFDLRTMLVREAMRDLKAAEEREGVVRGLTSSAMEKVADYCKSRESRKLVSPF